MRKRRVTRNHMGSPAQVRVLLVSILNFFFFFPFWLFVQTGLTCDSFLLGDCGLGFMGVRHSGERWVGSFLG